ncbi:MAG TPA: hypothetical protein VI278_04115 [Nitrososphaeraceae archaeon]
MTTISSDTISGKTEVIHDEQNVINTVLRFVSNTKCKIDACVDYTRPSLATGIEQLKKVFLDAKSRGVKLRYITEVTEENVGYCKELIRMVNELRHIEGIKGNFYVSETEYIAPASLHAKGRPSSQIIYSNVKEIVEHQQQYVFDSYWSRAIPAIVADTTWPICIPNDLRQILVILLLYAEKNRIVRCERKDLNLNSLRIHFPILVIVHALIFQLYDFRNLLVRS